MDVPLPKCSDEAILGMADNEKVDCESSKYRQWHCFV